MTEASRYMALALSLGRRGLGRVWPNPAVGCVIVKEGRIVGRGWTQPGGRPHAETQALAQAGAQARGADVYVTLEPCAHHGKTPPCAAALVKAGVARVFAATGDPDSRVHGAGFRALEQAGIHVQSGILEAQARRDNAGFFARVELDRPFMTLKLAGSFDGRIATGTGESKWITGPQARRVVHALRARHDAVMVGAGTARKDDPALTVRDLGTTWQPARVVISRRLDVSLMGVLARTASEVPVILCHGKDADPQLIRTWQDLGAVLLPCAARGGQLDPADVMRQLAGHGLTRIFCEGGSALAASLFEADLVDELIGFTAGLAIGAEGLPSIGALGLSNLSRAPRYGLRSTQRIGSDIMHIWERAQPD
ncbi:bifunctional diaminohydroxyphosphoribosylaminopyrimidine deaminase/5-amino-6-(5-phosphoribosylamino)uracil reductase RibD [Roseobacter sp. OBYS 0001]|uniref:bifunctional diaminohydroxyphosphoribosylaminopyrimidine deaminase/5-amino-6-(5-phosphoribosylamino)uracil reductase RibD n=1 Tax=Roseobacter sp. OBYS 0001 TaxID=882651 RepID=UPI001BC20D52|nr:bifunctional diaminohydroxyphosphoribosylaminopyrimidine deaminase/5-amino-6-(5-phosphoribosylamino)uracil reductase RibD [Roseobacter sp. OBYS 0001]GIT86943.1 riboflavin biosynthesis protein RibD [Roseobacter sp. OBYS 0001]